MYKFLSIYGPTGLTSYLSIKRQIETFKLPRQQVSSKDITILVSSAAGGVGLTLGEYLNKLGYHNVFGIAGSDAKCKKVVQIGYRNAINYKQFQKGQQFDQEGFRAAVFAATGGKQIDIYYENVGEQMLSSILPLMSNFSKIILCGALATYNNWKDKQGISNYVQIIMKRIEMKGILYFHEPPNSMMQNMIEMLQLGVKGVETVLQGISQLPSAYRDTIYGKYIGKTIVQF